MEIHKQIQKSVNELCTKTDALFHSHLLNENKNARIMFTKNLITSQVALLEGVIRVMQHQARVNLKSADAVADWGDVYLTEQIELIKKEL